jgi:hypothetical protein
MQKIYKVYTTDIWETITSERIEEYFSTLEKALEYIKKEYPYWTLREGTEYKKVYEHEEAQFYVVISEIDVK